MRFIYHDFDISDFSHLFPCKESDSRKDCQQYSQNNDQKTSLFHFSLCINKLPESYSHLQENIYIKVGISYIIHTYLLYFTACLAPVYLSLKVFFNKRMHLVFCHLVRIYYFNPDFTEEVVGFQKVCQFSLGICRPKQNYLPVVLYDIF